ncbi:MAG: phosphoglyceromutase [Flavobacteriaceae bacterium]|nr:phosphoglyceromutase [Flavobacteriaceae bacterium]
MSTISQFSILCALVLAIGCTNKTEQKKAVGTDTDESEKVILITLDGLRWQEVFQGIDSILLHNQTYAKAPDLLEAQFWKPTAKERRETLMPFFWKTIVKEGFLMGNRELGSYANLTNAYWFSYPGYNEILTGKADDQRIQSNDKNNNPNKTILELANEQDYKGMVAAFGSWDRFRYIINSDRSGIPVNDGYASATANDLSAEEIQLNRLQKQAVQPWPAVRQDVFTHNFALEYMKRKHPKLVYIAYGETDDFAHDGNYWHYILATKNTDALLQEIWEFCQTDSFYKNKTTILITTDHGRGTQPVENWMHHGDRSTLDENQYTIEGSDQVWIAGIGSQFKAMGEMGGPQQVYTNQIAPTVAKLLQIKTPDMAQPLAIIKE